MGSFEFFESADQQLIRIVAILLNRYSDAVESQAEATGEPVLPRYRYPEGGYSLVYSKIPRSPSELKEHREHVLGLLAAGMTSRVEAYAALNDVPLEIAAVRLAELDAANAPAPGATPATAAAPTAEAAPQADSVEYAHSEMLDGLDDLLDDLDDGATPAQLRAALIAIMGRDPNAADEDTEDPPSVADA
jgi:hypothetical protein